MGPGRAILVGFLRTGQTWGRATRSEFWWFAPVGALPPVMVGVNRPWLVLGWASLQTIAVVAVASLPLLSAAARRLQDTGEPGVQAFYPVSGLLMLWAGLHALPYVFAIPFVGWTMLVLVVMVPALLIGIILIATFAVLATGAQVLGMLLVPPDPGSNRYGPNPREAAR